MAAAHNNNQVEYKDIVAEKVDLMTLLADQYRTGNSYDKQVEDFTTNLVQFLNRCGIQAENDLITVMRDAGKGIPVDHIRLHKVTKDPLRELKDLLF